MGEGEQYAVSRGGFGLDGEIEIEVPTDKPCYISLINNRRNNIDYSLAGSDILAYRMIISYPYNITNYTMVPLGQTIRVAKSEDMTLIYLGSVNNWNSTSIFKWKNVPDSAVKSALYQICLNLSLIAIMSVALILA